ncbi:hypothetical protein OH77DRAFT_935958 [Trametes cingulata]|nr:hypothetical protein OH77DRAFT_935958 [Trametes cingulata]
MSQEPYIPLDTTRTFDTPVRSSCKHSRCYVCSGRETASWCNVDGLSVAAWVDTTRQVHPGPARRVPGERTTMPGEASRCRRFAHCRNAVLHCKLRHTAAVQGISGAQSDFSGSAASYRPRFAVGDCAWWRWRVRSAIGQKTAAARPAKRDAFSRVREAREVMNQRRGPWL